LRYSTDFLKGLSALVAGDYDSASRFLKSAALGNSEMIEAYYAAGLVFRKQKQFDRAAYVIESILRGSGLDASAKRALNVELGKIYFFAGEYEKSFKLLEMTSDPDGTVFKGKSLIQLGRFDEAAGTYKSIMKSTKEDMSREMGHCFYLAAESSEGAKRSKFIKSAMKHVPKSRAVRLLNIEQLTSVGRKSRAMAEIEKFLNDELPACEADMMRFQEIYFDDNKLEELMRISLKKVHESSDNPFFYIYAVRRLMAGNNADKAKEVLDKFTSSHGVSNLIAKASLEITPNEILRRMLEESDLYKCSSCGESQKSYETTCPSCHSFETIKTI